ncbi:hypothetical protein [Enterococcus faecalis]|uniref:hypothetical protein n=1 Tax=Enterococcus faecalis TaxID=1351 RepID=UPI0001F0BAC7|nr:hypothetical protein [Enterococcus faecalis]EFU15834.1 hypothetical protein HMPREF9518_00333 [Enterococcus faecalis TX1342]WEU33119.1 hypothetical protein P3W65_11600 [Enterococcus faecalis]HAP3007762.1 hypothetical protein [Enterococcus faecalis]HBC7248526.1 hypothetical protein [Enterococcus faecalis]
MKQSRGFISSLTDVFDEHSFLGDQHLVLLCLIFCLKMKKNYKLLLLVAEGEMNR